MISIEFHYRSSQRKKNSEGSLYFRVIAHRKTVSLTLPYRVYPSEWDAVHKRILVDDAVKERREYLREVSFLLEKDRRLLEELKGEVRFVDPTTSRSLVDMFRSRRFKSGFKRMVDFLSDELRRLGRERTARAYQSSLSSLLTYLGKGDISPGEITYTSLKGLEGSLLERGRSLNTVSFYMRNLRAVYNKSVKRGWIVQGAKDLFEDVYTGVAKSEKRALTIKQLKQLENLLENPETLEEEKEAVSLFLFSFHGRGISFVDMAYLKKKDVKKKLFLYHRKKTDTPLEVEINPVMRRIISFFEKKTEGSPFLFPLIRPTAASYYKCYTNALQKQNKRLKEIAAKTDSLEKLTTHMARHSWATIAKEKGIPVWVISEALGHQNIKTTYIYLASFEKKVIHEAARKVSLAIRKSTM